MLLPGLLTYFQISTLTFGYSNKHKVREKYFRCFGNAKQKISLFVFCETDQIISYSELSANRYISYSIPYSHSICIKADECCIFYVSDLRQDEDEDIYLRDVDE